MKIVWSPLAIDRITEIAEYISEDSPRSAEKLIDSVFKKVSRLKKYPESGRIVPELEISRIREIIYGNYRIIYGIKREAIIILTIRHSRQILPEEEIELAVTKNQAVNIKSGKAFFRLVFAKR